MIYNNEDFLLLKKIFIMMFSLGEDFVCNSNLFYYSREVQFECPEELEQSYFFTGRKKIFTSNRRASWGTLGAETDNCYMW